MTIDTSVPNQLQGGGIPTLGQMHAAQNQNLQNRNLQSPDPQSLGRQNSSQTQSAQMWHVKLLMDTGAALAAAADSQQSWDAFVQFAKQNGLDNDGHLPAVFDPKLALHYAQLGVTVSDQLSAQLKQLLHMPGAAENAGTSASEPPVQTVAAQATPTALQTAPSMQGSQKATGKTLAIGTVQDGYRYQGGHPGRASNWVPVPPGE